jgi:alginate O-acetyltransferase complex protein AlgJ
MHRFFNLTLVAGFLIVIALPLAANIAGKDGGDQEAENRDLATFPTFERTWESAVAWPSGLDEWFQDHFGFRSTLVRWYGESRYYGLHVSPSAPVVRGKDGWLYYADDGGLDDYTNEQPLPPGEIENWRQTIVRARDWCRAHGVAYVFTIVPDKPVIYPDYYDDHVRQLSPVSRADQVFTAALDTGVVLDVRQALLAGRSRDRLYHKTDTHWNDRGAFLAYQQIIDAVHRQLPAVPPARDRSAFNATSRMLNGRDLAAIIGLKRVLSEEDLLLVPKKGRGYVVVEPRGSYATAGQGRIVTEIPGSTLPRAVVFRDSFTSLLAPFLSEHFSRAVYLWQNNFDADEVLKEHADVVIEEIVGRHLHNFIPSPELIPDVEASGSVSHTSARTELHQP